MIKIHFLDGYKYLGSYPDNLGKNLRDNLTYCCFEITNWTKDQDSFKFLLKNHIAWIDSDEADDYIKQYIGTYVINNKTTKLYFLVNQHSINTEGRIVLSVKNRKADKHQSLLKLIKNKKDYYNHKLNTNVDG